jgi:hypothetical protein
VTVIIPVTAAAGTVVVICPGVLTTKVAGAPPKLTSVVPVKLLPKIVTDVPVEPLPGLKLVIEGAWE